MSYGEFAYWYDALNEEADYDGLMAALLQALHAQGIHNGIVADLGCGTGEISLRLANAGYDVISVDKSPDMLSVLREKQEEQNLPGILLLLQDLSELDLYGTIRAAVSTFDTFNHLPPSILDQALARISLFMESGGVLLFDANTPFKHSEILGNNNFAFALEENLDFIWKNKFDSVLNATKITLEITQNGEQQFCENFYEYIYPIEFWESILPKHGFRILQICDGETFQPLASDSQRYFIKAVKE